MFSANTDQEFVASKTISIKPDSQIDYVPSSQARFLIPQYLGFVNPERTTVKFNIELTGRGWNRPCKYAGAHSLIRDIRIQTGDGVTELENLQDYNQTVANSWNYTGNETINNKRDMFEGRSVNADVEAGLLYHKPPAIQPTDATVIRSTAVNEKIQVQLPIVGSGILGGSNIVPLMAMSGLRMTVNFDTAEKSMSDLRQDGVGYYSGYSMFAPKLGVAKAIGDDSKTALGTEFTCTVAISGDDKIANNPFFIGDRLFVADNVGGTNEEVLGVVTGVSIDTTNGNQLKLTYIPQRAIGAGLVHAHATTSSVYVQLADRQADHPQGWANTGITTNYPPIGWVISELELITDQVQPPAEYVSRLVNKVGTAEGLSMDYKTYTTYRNNVFATSGLTTQDIPAQQTRAYSILSVPLATRATSDIRYDSFQAEPDDATSYQYVLGNATVPDRMVDLSRTTTSDSAISQLALLETEKAISNCGLVVRDLINVKRKLIIGRALSRYGQVYNLAEDSVALRVEYPLGARVAKNFCHQICSLNRLNISKSGVRVMR